MASIEMFSAVKRRRASSSRRSWTKAPGDSILNHELGHADNNTHGTRDLTPTPVDSYGNMEEFNNLPADNSYRHERNPDPDFQRKDYGDF